MGIKKQIEVNDIIKGEYEVIDSFSLKIWMTEPYSFRVLYNLPSGTFQNEEEIEKVVSDDLEYLYFCILTIRLDLKEFEKLSANYSALHSGLYIQLYNKRFYSSYEEERFRRQMEERLEEGYDQLYDKYITNPSPVFKMFKDNLDPVILPTLIKAIQEKEEED